MANRSCKSENTTTEEKQWVNATKKTIGTSLYVNDKRDGPGFLGDKEEEQSALYQNARRACFGRGATAREKDPRWGGGPASGG